MRRDLKIIKRESLVLWGFTTVWFISFLLRDRGIFFKWMIYFAVYAYAAHIAVKVSLWLKRLTFKE